jgi:hypothetical protein
MSASGTSFYAESQSRDADHVFDEVLAELRGRKKHK